MHPTAETLARWAASFTPTADEHALADRSLLDTVAVAISGRVHPVLQAVGGEPEVARWAVAAHVLDFDDLHMESTSHISAVCVPAVLASGGDALAYLAAAGVMARLGVALGWPHYSAGWHATCTAGAPAAAVAAGVALRLDAERMATALALSVPAAGGMQRAFGTDAKSLQVGFAAEAGLRAARMARAGVSADITAMDTWLTLVGGDPGRLPVDGPAVPGGLAVKLYPCCYAMQRPISAVAGLKDGSFGTNEIARVVLRTPRATVTPLIHHDPRTGLAGKFSIEYAVATALLDDHQGLGCFTDEAVGRPQARRLMRLVETELSDDGDGLLAGSLEAEIQLVCGDTRTARVDAPPGSPQRPLTDQALARKIADCLQGTPIEPEDITWRSAAGILRSAIERNTTWKG